MVRASFAHRRKTLQNSLCEALGLPSARVSGALGACGFAERVRAEALRPHDFVSLAKALQLPPQTQG